MNRALIGTILTWSAAVAMFSGCTAKVPGALTPNTRAVDVNDISREASAVTTAAVTAMDSLLVANDGVQFNFGDISVNVASPYRSVRLKNTGDYGIQLLPDMVVIDGNFLLQPLGNGCRNAFIPAKAECDIGIGFSPLQDGAHNGGIAFKYRTTKDNLVKEASLKLTGQGVRVDAAPIPVELLLSAVHSDGATLRWNGGDGADRIDIYYSSNGIVRGPIGLINGSTHEYRLTGLRANTAYGFQIAAVNGMGRRWSNNVFIGKTGNESDRAPSDVRAQFETSAKTRVRLKWRDESSNSAVYCIVYSGSFDNRSNPLCLSRQSAAIKVDAEGSLTTTFTLPKAAAILDIQVGSGPGIPGAAPVFGGQTRVIDPRTESLVL